MLIDKFLSSSHPKYGTSERSGFTLIELLIVIAIIAILSVVVILTLNPASLLQQSRDANRVSDMSLLTSAIGVYAAGGGTSFGNTNTVYVSIADPSATSTAGDQCQGLGLGTLPSSYSYHCAASSTLRNVNGNGWIPINFGAIAIGSSLSQLPIDPTNQSSSNLYYTYTTNGSQFEVTAPMESAKYQVGGSNDVISTDGGPLVSVYEKGSKLGLEPLDYADNTLAAYWSLNEGTGTTAYDYSGNNASGTWNGTQTGSSGYYSAGRGGAYSWAGAFDGSTNDLSMSSSPIAPGSNLTIAMWIQPIGTTGALYYWGVKSGCNPSSQGFRMSTQLQFSTGCGSILTGSTSVSLNQWHQAVATIDSSGNVTMYLDGIAQNVASSTRSGQSVATGNDTIGASYSGGVLGNYFHGLIGDVRVYDRVFTAGQVAAMYAGGK